MRTLLPVLKVNRQVTFTTGTYQYRLMHTLFFHRATQFTDVGDEKRLLGDDTGK